MILGAVMLLCALSLFIYNKAEDQSAGEASEQMLADVIGAIENNWKKSTLTEDTAEDVETDMPVVEIGGYSYIGYISFPELGIELPVMADWSNELMQLSPCRYYGSVMSDDMVILGHNYTRHFGRLSRLSAGSSVIFTDMNGMIYSYEVAALETISGDNVEDMIETDYDLTLFTCDYSGRNRLTLRCTKQAAPAGILRTSFR